MAARAMEHAEAIETDGAPQDNKHTYIMPAYGMPEQLFPGLSIMPSGPYQQTLGFILNDTARLLRKRFEQRARHLGLTRAQWQALAYLARNEGIQQGLLAEILELEPITLGRILDRLEAAELIERRRHAADRRVWLLHLKPKAHALMADMFEIGDATRAEALADVSEADREALTRILTTMKANLAEACSMPVEGAAPARRATHG